MDLLEPAALERLRDRTFRRLPGLRLGSLPAVLRFVDRVGFAFLYRTSSEAPSLWQAIAGRRNPRLPRRIQSHAGVGLAWEAKDVLAARRKLFYGKLLLGSPTLVSLELFPAFYALSGNQGRDDDHLRWAREGLLSPDARRIWEVLLPAAPLSTGDLKARAGLASPRSRVRFDRAMAELQGKLLAVKYAELYEPRFTFLWGPLHRWLPAQVEAARDLDPGAARQAILERYLAVRWAAAQHEVERLFGWPRRELCLALAALEAAGKAERRELRRAGPVHAVAGIERALRR